MIQIQSVMLLLYLTAEPKLDTRRGLEKITNLDEKLNQ